MKKSLLFSAMMMTMGVAAATTVVSPVARQPLGNIAMSVKKNDKIAANKLKANLATKAEVVKTKTLKNGAKIDLVKGSDGMLHKVIQKNSVKKNGLRVPQTRIAKSYYDDTEDATLYEGFEGYDGESRGWVPTGWSQVSKTDPAHAVVEDGTCLIWEGITGDSWTPANSGEAAERIQVSVMDYDTFAPAEEQDEWLITPAVNVKSGDYLCFELNYSPAFTLLDVDTFEFTAENNILEVQVSVDNGETWNKIWDVLPHAKSFTEDELWDDAMSYIRGYYPMAVNLDQLAGQNVKFAFRYVGINGESMILDDVFVGAPTPEASITAPSSVFQIGYSKEGYVLTDASGNWINYGLAPYMTPLTWDNNTELYETAKWSYPDPETGDALESDDDSLEAPAYGYGNYEAPSLQVTLGKKTSEAVSTHDAVRYGGAIYSRTSDGDIISFDPVFYDTPRVESDDAEIAYSVNIFGAGEGHDATWTSLMGATYKSLGLEYVIPKPAAPFVVSSAWIGIQPGDKLTDASKLTATIYKLDEETLSYVEMAKATCLPSEIEDDGENVPVAEFKFTQTQGELEVETPIMIDYNAVIAFDGEMASGESFNFYTQFDSEVTKSYPTYVRLADEDGTLGELNITALTFTDGSCATGIYGAWDATYAWFLTDEDSFEAPVAGGEKEFKIDSYYSVKDSAGDDSVTVEGEGLDDWYTVSFDEVDADDYNGAMTVTVSALPEGVDIRSAYFDINQYGFTKRYYVAQRSEASVNTLAASTTKAQVVGSDIAVSSQKATSVAVYNVAGQKVAEKAFSGKATISAADLAKGVYVLKFNDNTVLKLAK